MKKQYVLLEEVHKSEKERMQYAVSEKVISLFLLCGFLSVSFCFSAPSPILLLMLLFPIVLLCLKNQLMRDIVKIVLVLFCMGAVLYQPAGFVNGLLIFGNQLLTIWSYHFGTYAELYKVTTAAGSQLQFWIVFSGVFYLFYNWMIETGKQLVFALLELAAVLAAVFFGLSLNVILVLFFFYGLMLAAMGNSFLCQGFKGGIVLSLVLAVLITAVTTGTAGFHASSGVDVLKTAILNGIEYIRYGEDTLPQGDMTIAERMVGSSEKEALRMSASSFDEMHFRGFTGSEFDGSRWSTLNLSNYGGENQGMLEWLTARGLSVPYQFGRFALQSGNANGQTHVVVRNVGAYRKYIYLPYAVSSLDGGRGKVNYDWQIISSGIAGEKKYRFTASKIESASGLALEKIVQSAQTSEEGKQAEQAYQAFVYKNYLKMDENEKAEIENTFYHHADVTTADYYELTNQIRLTLQQINHYTEQPGEVYRGTEDFVKWFCEGTHECNASAYATMAVLAYRTAGVPARYVEGYFLKQDQITAKAQELVLTQADAHAWPEVYISGVGWLPVEVIPGSYYADYTVQDVAPSPESTVDVVENNEEELKGTTSDEIKTDKKNPPDLPEPVVRVLYVFGAVLLLFMLLFTGICIIRIQAAVRRTLFEKVIENPENIELQCRKIYQQIFKIFSMVTPEAEPAFPRKYTEVFENCFADIEPEEYERFISLIEKCIFSRQRITAAEYHTVKMFYQRVKCEAFKTLSYGAVLKLKYVYAV